MSLTAQVRYVGQAKLRNEWASGVDVDENGVPAIAYLDLRGSYTVDLGGQPTELTLAIDNVFNSDPPRVAAAPGTIPYSIVAPGTRLDLYDAIGRAFRVGVRAKF